MNLNKSLSTVLLIAANCWLATYAQAPAKPPAQAVATSIAKPPAPHFHVCEGTFALCTFSQCKPITQKGKIVGFNCTCPVRNSEYSVGEMTCDEAKAKISPDGQKMQMRSRYSPISTYSRCTNSRPWAMCLDSLCTTETTGATTAECACLAKHSQGDYLVQPETNQCTAGHLSSATVVDLDQITDFLETQPNLTPAPFTVVNTTPK